MKWYFVALALCGFPFGLRADDVEVALGKVRETRINDQTSALSVEIIGGGELIHLVRAAIFRVAEAVDDTGGHLPMKGKPKIVWDINNMRRDRDKAAAWLHLQSPSRHATMLKEFSGVIDFVLPSRDPSSVVTVRDLVKQSGKAVDAPLLKQSAAKVTLWVKREFDVAYPPESDWLNEPLDPLVLSQLPEDERNNLLVAARQGTSERTIVVECDDPGWKIADVALFEPDGLKVSTSSERELLKDGRRFTFFEVKKTLPKDLKALIYVATEKVTVRKPFSFTNIPLP